jgi:uncharacterized membrane protein YukC
MLAKKVYGEWLVPVVDYYSTLKSNERNYEILFPVIISLIVTITYINYGDSFRALMKLRDILPNALAILIGFTISCITILVASDNATIRNLKDRDSDNRIVRNKIISIFQWLLITFIYILIVQVFLLTFIFFVSFVLQVHRSIAFTTTTLAIEVYCLLHVLLLLVRNITNFYFVFFVKEN